MDLAYDHIAEESLPKDEEAAGQPSQNKAANPQSTLNADIQAAYSAFSSSPWGAKIGGFFGSVVKQGETVYREAQQEVSALGQDATRGLSDLRASIVSRTRGLSLTTPSPFAAGQAQAQTERASDKDKDKDQESTPTGSRGLSHDEAIRESETVLSRLRGEAAKRLRDLQRAEDAADEALLKFGTNIRDFLREAISIAPPPGGEGEGGASGAGGAGAPGAVLFESRDAHGKRVIHTSRFDAQLHVIHTNPDSFAKDPSGEEYAAWTAGFDIDNKTADISSDLAKYPELRATMEKLVPDVIPYANFWKRYYFLRHGIETAEARRRDLLKAASAEEEVGWDEDSEDEDEDEDDEEGGPSKSAATAAPTTTTKLERPGSTGSSTTIHAATGAGAGASVAAPPAGLLKPSSPRKSNDEKSQADSEASYDIVGAKSGVPSQAPNSPKEARKADDSEDSEDSEEEDWE